MTAAKKTIKTIGKDREHIIKLLHDSTAGGKKEWYIGYKKFPTMLTCLVLNHLNW